MMTDLVSDLRYAWRGLRRTPSFTAVAIATVALGIGINTAVLGVVNGVLLRPFPFPRPDRLVMIREDMPEKNMLGMTASPPNFLDWRAQNRSFSDLAAYARSSDPLTGSGEPEQVDYASTTGSFFSVLGVRPALGRVYSPAECAAGKDHVAVLSHALWLRRFGGRPDAVGSTIRLGGEPYTVIGVATADLVFPLGSHDLWTPLDFGPDVGRQRGAHYISVVGRLRDGVSLATAEAEMKGIAARLAAAYPDQDKGHTVSLRILKEQIVGKVKPALLVLTGAVTLVLLIACGNVANLLLARGARREREIAVRRALGAGRARIVRQLLTESMLLAAAGTAAGVGLAVLADRWIARFGPTDIPRLAEAGIDGAVLAATAAIAAATAILFGLAPALRATASSLPASLRETAPGDRPARRRTRDFLVAAEMALALLLLAGAGLLVKSFANLVRVDPGFRPDHVLTFDLSLDAKYKDPASRSAFYRDLLARLDRIPGVRASGAVFCAPLSTSSFSSSFTVEGAPVAKSDEPSMNLRVVSPDYFSTMRIPLVAGRLFTDHDRRGGQRVLLITRSAARRFWPNGDAIGKYLRMGARPVKENVEGTIVGIVGDTRDESLSEEPAPAAYFPLDQVGVSGLTVVVRTVQRPETAGRAVRDAVGRMDADLPVVGMTSMEEVVSRSVSAPRFYAFLLAVFSAAALALAAIGIYGVLSYAVAARTREIGVRIAIGARRRDVVAMVLGGAARLAGIGLAAGLAGALLLTRLLSGILFGVKPFDPATYAAVSGILFAVALIAALLPARRASSIDPMAALRQE
ncbi:MAG TPA: ABC transporter permease [Thermoanaerobaculia bacterium]|nr:ABC transporter permease [Thermoanaerobaculia bacterium]